MRNLKKLLAVIVAICLVATLSVPAFAADAPAYGTQATTLNTLGLYDGISATSFDPDLGTAVDRQTAIALLVKMLGKKADASAMAAADQDAALANFTDAKDLAGWAKPFMAYAVKNGITNGTSTTTLSPKDAVTGNMFATFILRNLGYTVDDVNTGLATLQAKGGLTAAQATAFAKDLVKDDIVGIAFGALQAANKDGKKLINVLVDAKVVDAAKAEAAGVYTAAVTATAAATGAYKLTVTFNQAVDTAKAAFTVKKTSVTMNVNKVTFADDKKSAVLEMTNKLTAGDYAITVAGLTDTALTATVTAADEKVTKIEFTNGKAVIDRADNTIVTTPVVVYNQYNEDVTSTYEAGLTPTAGKGTASVSGGIVTIDAASAFAVDEKVAISLIDAASGTYATTVLTAVDVAKIADVSISKLYNADGATLTAGETSPGDWVLVVEAKDQYGNAITDPVKADADLLATVSNEAIATIDGFVGVANTVNFANTTIDGATKLTLALADNGTGITAGTTKVSLISKTTGKLASFDVVVKEGVKVDTLTLSAPVLAVGGEDVEIPFTAVDQFGSAVTDPAVLNAISSLSSTLGAGTVAFEKDYVKNVTKLVLDASGQTTATTVVVTAVTNTNKVVQLNIALKAAAVPTVISGIKDFTNVYAVNGSAEMTIGNIVVKDQYGRDITPTLGVGNYAVSVASGTAGNVDVEGGASAVIDNAADSLTFGGIAKGSSTITLKLQTVAAGPAYTDVANSAITFTAKTVEKADIASYAIADIGKIFADRDGANTHAATVTVNGLLADGTKVAIPNSAVYYIANLINGDSANDGLFEYDDVTGTIAADATITVNDAKEATATLIVTVAAANGQVILTKPITATTATRVITTLEIASAGNTTVQDAAAFVVSAPEPAIDTAGELATEIGGIITAKDQYGVAMPLGVITVIYSNFSAHDLATLVSGDTFVVTVITSNAKVLTFKVIVE